MIAALFAASVLCAPASAPAGPPLITPKVLQCDGSFTTGSVTSHPTPTVRAEEQSTNPGLKVGRRRLSVLSATFALWRFDGNYTITVSSCYTGGCTGGDSCKTWTWVYDDSNGSADAQTGQCTYRDALGTTCSNAMSLYGGAAPNQTPVPIGGASCPASTTTLPSGSGSVAITPAGPLPGLASSGLSANALQLDGSSLYASAANSAAWNLPASYTLSAWINATGATGRIVSQQGAAGYWGIGVSGGGLRHFDSRDAAAGSDLTRGSG
ncbi:MAG: hypothetical protein NUW21_01960, partial [Elusimicrobia bacterium]|nr:hypothetical protein [Elusimicrobiota bacterium]